MTREVLLELQDVSIAINDDIVCSKIDLQIREGENHILVGPNGSGKSTLLGAIMGLSPYDVVEGEILFKGQSINELTIDDRARLGIGLAFQRPPKMTGISVRMLATALGDVDRLSQESEHLDLAAFEHRDINDGFSGGEVKRWEVLKLALQQPQLCLFDEPESGVDLEHIGEVGRAIDRLVSQSSNANELRSALVITHTGFILEHLTADVGHLMVDGQIIYSGNPKELFEHIKRSGYNAPQELAST